MSPFVAVFVSCLVAVLLCGFVLQVVVCRVSHRLVLLWFCSAVTVACRSSRCVVPSSFSPCRCRLSCVPNVMSCCSFIVSCLCLHNCCPSCVPLIILSCHSFLSSHVSLSQCRRHSPSRPLHYSSCTPSFTLKANTTLYV